MLISLMMILQTDYANQKSNQFLTINRDRFINLFT